jgi:hypothetical protein
MTERKREELNAVFGKPNTTKIPTPMPGLVALQASQYLKALYFLDYREKRKTHRERSRPALTA